MCIKVQQIQNWQHTKNFWIKSISRRHLSHKSCGSTEVRGVLNYLNVVKKNYAMM